MNKDSFNNILVGGTLIVVIVLILTIFSGCTEVGIGLTNIGDIQAYPEDYYGKQVTVEGSCGSFNRIITDDTGHSLRYEYNNGLSGMYRLTGIYRKENYNGLKFDSLVVTDVKAL